MDHIDIIKLLVSLSIPIAVEIVTGMVTVHAISTWFATLNKPSFNPPNWLFAPVWTTLYLLMGISLYLIWKMEPSAARDQAIWIFAIQLTLNAAWSIIFFYFHRIGLALADIITLQVFIIVMLVVFYQLNPLAAYLNIPYLLWVSFATVLNASFYRLN